MDTSIFQSCIWNQLGLLGSCLVYLGGSGGSVQRVLTVTLSPRGKLGINRHHSSTDSGRTAMAVGEGRKGAACGSRRACCFFRLGPNEIAAVEVGLTSAHVESSSLSSSETRSIPCSLKEPSSCQSSLRSPNARPPCVTTPPQQPP